MKKNRLIHKYKVNDSLIDDEAFWLKYVEELDETKSIGLVNSETAVALVAKDKAGLGVSDPLADILWDWLDTFESVADVEILSLKFAIIVSDGGKDENRNWVCSLVNNLEDSLFLHRHYP